MVCDRLARLQGSVAGLETTLQKAQGFVQQFDRDELSEWGEIGAFSTPSSTSVMLVELNARDLRSFVANAKR